MRISRPYRYRKIFDGYKRNPVGKPKGFVDVNSKSSVLRRAFASLRILTTRQAVQYAMNHGIESRKYAERCLQLLIGTGEIERVKRGLYKVKEAA